MQPVRWIRNIAEAYTVSDSGLGVARGIDVVIEGGVITALRPADARRPVPEGVEVIDATGLLALPGLVDGHNHLWQVLIRGCGADMRLPEWLEHCVFPWREVPPTFEESYALTRYAAAELVSSGVTTVVDWNHSFSQSMVAGALAALEDSGLRYRLAVFPGLAPDAAPTSGPHADEVAEQTYGGCGAQHGPEHGAAVDAACVAALDPEWVRFIETKAAAFAQGGAPHKRLGGLHLATHPPRSEGWDERHLLAASALAQRLGLPLNLHFHEHPSEVRSDSLAVIEAAGATRVPLILNHAVHLSAQDIATLGRWQTAGQGAAVIYNAQSNARLGSGVMPLASLQGAGCAVGLGLDGAAGDRFDAFSNLRMSIGLQRAATAHMVSIAEGLRLATLGGARALGLDAHIGSLEVGKAADVILVDPSTPHFAFTPGTAELVLTGGPESVAWVLVAGRVLKAPAASGRGLPSTAALRAAAASAAQALYRRKPL